MTRRPFGNVARVTERPSEGAALAALPRKMSPAQTASAQRKNAVVNRNMGRLFSPQEFGSFSCETPPHAVRVTAARHFRHALAEPGRRTQFNRCEPRVRIQIRPRHRGDVRTLRSL